LRRVTDNLHILSKQHHGIHRHSDRPHPKPEEAAKVNDDPYGPLAVAYDLTHRSKYILALYRLQHIPVPQITHTHRLREAHRPGAGQTHPRRRRHPTGRRALSIRRGGKGDQCSADA
jgi:hypothetical protein